MILCALFLSHTFLIIYLELCDLLGQICAINSEDNVYTNTEHLFTRVIFICHLRSVWFVYLFVTSTHVYFQYHHIKHVSLDFQ